MKLIRNIWCVGRNFRDHAAELNNPIPASPLFFLKAGSCAVFPGQAIRLPSFSLHIDYELEIALRFNDQLKVDQACLALDLTARDQQTIAKKDGLPWTLAKSFPCACPLGPFFPLPSLTDPLSFSLSVNGQTRQQGSTTQMIFPLLDLVAYCLAYFPVCPGDLLLTGTPSGVSKAHPGDHLHALIPKMTEIHWSVTQ